MEVWAYHIGATRGRAPVIRYAAGRVTFEIRGAATVTLTLEELSEAWSLVVAHSKRNDTLPGESGSD